jgi:hypothetical protein
VGERGELCVNSLSHGPGHSLSQSLVLGGVPELLSKLIAWQMVYPEETILVKVRIVSCHKDVSSVLPGMQGA